MLGIIGAGSWGTALAVLLAKNNSQIQIPVWDIDEQQLQEMQNTRYNTHFLPDIYLPENLHFIRSLSELIQQTKDLIIVVPSKAFIDVISKIKPFLTTEHRIAWATKGLEPGTGDFLSNCIHRELGDQLPIAVLSGPSFAREVAQGLPTAVVIAANNNSFLKDMVQYFHASTFRIYPSDDLLGVQLGGVVKNILAVATGISDGLGFGANTRAALITRGLAEMLALGQKFGVQPETLYGLAGLGDVVLTCLDDQSRNRRFGLAIAAGKTIAEAKQEIGQEIEAIENITTVCAKAANFGVDIPIAQQINLVLNNTISPKQAVANLLERKPAWEENL